MVDGVGDYTFNMAREFARHGHDAHVICRNRREIRTDYDDMHVVPMVERWNRKTGRCIARYVKEKKIDVVSLQYVPHGFDRRGLPFSIAILSSMLRGTGATLFTFFHEVSIGRDGSYSPRRSVGAFLMSMIARHIALQSAIVATSITHYKKRFERLSVSNVAVIPIPSNVPPCTDSELHLHEVRRSVASEDCKVITLFGNRDFAPVVRAIKRLIESGRKIRVIALGKPNGTIPKEDFVYFTGPKEIGELAAYLKVSDILVLPENTRSGCSLKSGSLAAAIQYGIPTVTARGFMTDEVLESLFVFVNDNTEEEYMRALSGLLDNPEVLGKMREKCLCLAGQITWSATYDRYMELIANK